MRTSCEPGSALFREGTGRIGLLVGVLSLLVSCVTTSPPKVERTMPTGEPARRQVMEPGPNAAGEAPSMKLAVSYVGLDGNGEARLAVTVEQSCDQFEFVPMQEVVVVEKKARFAWTAYVTGGLLLGAGIWGTVDAQQNLAPQSAATQDWEVPRETALTMGYATIGAGLAFLVYGGIEHLLAMDKRSVRSVEDRRTLVGQVPCEQFSALQFEGTMMGLTGRDGLSVQRTEGFLTLGPDPTPLMERFCEIPVGRVQVSSSALVSFGLPDGGPFKSAPGGFDFYWSGTPEGRERILARWTAILDDGLSRVLSSFGSGGEPSALGCRNLSQWMEDLSNDLQNCSKEAEEAGLAGFEYAPDRLTSNVRVCLATMEKATSDALEAGNLEGAAASLAVGERLAGAAGDTEVTARLEKLRATLNETQGQMYEKAVMSAAEAGDMAQANDLLRSMDAWASQFGGTIWVERAAALKKELSKPAPSKGGKR